MERELAGRVAIVTGAGRNIGRAIALSLAEAGAAVIVNARVNLAEAQAVVHEVERSGGKAMPVLADVVDRAAVEKMAIAAVDRFGGMHILVNNAAVRVEEKFATMTLAQWRAVTGIILEGAFNCAQACLPHLRRSGAGVIVNIGGLSSFMGAAGRAHVVSAKAGLLGFTRALAHELAPDRIRVNMVTPGMIATPRPPGPLPEHHDRLKSLAGRRGEPADVASAVRFLCGPQASFITGQNLQVNGGAYMG